VKGRENEKNFTLGDADPSGIQKFDLVRYMLRPFPDPGSGKAVTGSLGRWSR